MLEPDGPSFPFLSLVVSGGHTSLYLARSLGDYVVLGETVDDAAGEAFDKVARMLDLGYPGGPAVDRLAREGNPRCGPAAPTAAQEGAQDPLRTPGNARALDMSFSGLKTAVRAQLDRASSADICASFQQAVVDVLTNRVERAARETGVRAVTMAAVWPRTVSFARRCWRWTWMCDCRRSIGAPTMPP